MVAFQLTAERERQVAEEQVLASVQLVPLEAALLHRHACSCSTATAQAELVEVVVARLQLVGKQLRLHFGLQCLQLPPY